MSNLKLAPERKITSGQARKNSEVDELTRSSITISITINERGGVKDKLKNRGNNDTKRQSTEKLIKEGIFSKVSLVIGYAYLNQETRF